MQLPLEAVPNFSEGRDRATIDAIGAALAAHADLLDVHSDEDHNRSVYTLVAEPEPLVEALLAAIAVARERIDLRRHEGAHPRIGAADVVPVVPVKPEDALRARETALALARLDPAAGGVILGTRPPLIAFNVDLGGDDLEAAREIASLVRERDGGFPGVRALGLRLPRAGRVQVSLNVEDWAAAPLHELVATIDDAARARGLEVVRSELVGLMPVGAALAASAHVLRIDGFDARHVLELRLAER